MGVKEKGLHSGLRKGRGRLDYNRSDIKKIKRNDGFVYHRID